MSGDELIPPSPRYDPNAPRRRRTMRRCLPRMSRSRCLNAGSRKRKQKEPNDPNGMALATADRASGFPGRAHGVDEGFRRRRLRLLHQQRKRQGQSACGEPTRGGGLPLEVAFVAKSVREVLSHSFPTPRRTPTSKAEIAVRGLAPGPAPNRVRWKIVLALEKRIAEYALKFGVGEVPRPPNWRGYKLTPFQLRILARSGRSGLHDRLVFDPRRAPREPWTDLAALPLGSPQSGVPAA